MSEYIPGELAEHGQGYEDWYSRRADVPHDRNENERFERLSEYREPDYKEEEEDNG